MINFCITIVLMSGLLSGCADAIIDMDLTDHREISLKGFKRTPVDLGAIDYEYSYPLDPSIATAIQKFETLPDKHQNLDSVNWEAELQSSLISTDTDLKGIERIRVTLLGDGGGVLIDRSLSAEEQKLNSLNVASDGDLTRYGPLLRIAGTKVSVNLTESPAQITFSKFVTDLTIHVAIKTQASL